MNKYDKPMMATAFLWSNMSFCKKLKVGCVISKNNRIISVGYNGTLNFQNNTCCDEIDGKLVTKKEVQHAERNAMDICAKEGIPLKGCTMYITHAPCIECAKSIYSSGITSVIYKNKYKITEGIDLLQSVGVEVVQYEDSQ